MINITASTPNSAWKECISQLYQNGEHVDNDKYFRDELVVLEISEPCIEKAPIEFPIPQQELDIINNYIVTGENEHAVTHEWTKLYYKRIYTSPNNQYNYFLKKLSQPTQSGRAQISLWDKNLDQEAEIAPCTQIIWGRVKFNRLELHVHAHSVDAYKKLLMNQQEFITLQMHLAQQLKIGTGRFYHLIDSCHIHNSDITRVSELDFLR